jgi:hypothetical protein
MKKLIFFPRSKSVSSGFLKSLRCLNLQSDFHNTRAEELYFTWLSNYFHYCENILIQNMYGIH